MRLSFLFAPLMFLCVQTLGFASNDARSNESSVQCPSADTIDLDMAHLAMDVPLDFDFKTLVQGITDEMAQENDEPLTEEIQVQNSINFGYTNLTVLKHFTGRYKTVPSQVPEPIIEFVVIRPISDCITIDEKTYSTSYQVYSREFENDSLNIAVVRQLLDHDISVKALSPKGRAWICAVQPTKKICQAPTP